GAMGQAFVTAICGAVTSGQVVVTLLLTVLPVHWSRPVAFKVELAEQASRGAVNPLLKLAEAPGASEARVNTTVLGAGWLLTTVMFERVMFPACVTLPLEARKPPGAAGLAGQVCVTIMSGVVTSGQVTAAEALTGIPAHCPLALTLTVVVIEQALLLGTV